MSADTVSKWLGIAVMAGTPIVGLYVKLNALEDAKNGHADVLTEQRMELRKLQERLLEVERNREMIDRLHAIDVRLGRIEERLSEERRKTQRR